MANVKFVRRPRDKASPAREETPRRKRSRVERAVTADSIVSATSIQQPVPFVMSTDFDTSSVIPSGKSVAFPSLELCEPNRSPRVGRHGIERLIKERQGGDTKKRNESFRRIDRMYEARDLPRQMSTREREWYASLKVRMAARGDEPEHSFHSLWPSLRQTIIDEIREEVAGFYRSDYKPALILLHLEEDSFLSILDENTQSWCDAGEIPDYLLELKRQNLDKSVDPDTPPPWEIVKAIYYLKQEHLPASLLGEWQYPLPEFNLPTSALPSEASGTKPTDVIKAKSAHSGNSSTVPIPPQWSPITPAPRKTFERSQSRETKQRQTLVEKEALDKQETPDMTALIHHRMRDNTVIHVTERTTNKPTKKSCGLQPQPAPINSSPHYEATIESSSRGNIVQLNYKSDQSNIQIDSQQQLTNTTQAPAMIQFSASNTSILPSKEHARPRANASSAHRSGDGSTQAYLQEFRRQDRSKFPIIGNYDTPRIRHSKNSVPQSANEGKKTGENAGATYQQSAQKQMSPARVPNGMLQDCHLSSPPRDCNRPISIREKRDEPQGGSRVGMVASSYGLKQSSMKRSPPIQLQQDRSYRGSSLVSQDRQGASRSEQTASTSSEASHNTRCLRNPQRPPKVQHNPLSLQHNSQHVQSSRKLPNSQLSHQQFARNATAEGPVLMQSQFLQQQLLGTALPPSLQDSPHQRVPVSSSPSQASPQKIPVKEIRLHNTQSPYNLAQPQQAAISLQQIQQQRRSSQYNSEQKRAQQQAPTQPTGSNRHVPSSISARRTQQQFSPPLVTLQDELSSLDIYNVNTAEVSSPRFSQHTQHAQLAEQNFRPEAASVAQRSSPESFNFPNLMHLQPGSGSPQPNYGNPFSNITSPYFMKLDSYPDYSPYLPHQSPYHVYPISPDPQQSISSRLPPNASLGPMDPRLFANDQALSTHVMTLATATSNSSGLRQGKVFVSNVGDVNGLMKPPERKRSADQMGGGNIDGKEGMKRMRV